MSAGAKRKLFDQIELDCRMISAHLCKVLSTGKVIHSQVWEQGVWAFGAPLLGLLQGPVI